MQSDVYNSMRISYLVQLNYIKTGIKNTKWREKRQIMTSLTFDNYIVFSTKTEQGSCHYGTILRDNCLWCSISLFFNGYLNRGSYESYEKVETNDWVFRLEELLGMHHNHQVLEHTNIPILAGILCTMSSCQHVTWLTYAS